MKNNIPYRFGLTSEPLKLFDPKEKNNRRLEKLLKLKEASLITKICRHYITNFIPDPIANENEYWIISCYPSTDNSPVRISIWFPEVFNITIARHYFGAGNGLQCMVFVHREFWDSKAIHDAEKRVEGLFFHPGYRFVTGIREQLAAFMPLNSYSKFVEDEQTYESIRAHNYELTLKGRTPFKKGHNYEFVRYLLEH
ncbi:MAG: hypothetical protein M9898_12430 [Chitinophagaceae bacterium]|nr:hypothetical protein [Chitinophagaceae bacterium]